jgi:NTE family protein
MLKISLLIILFIPFFATSQPRIDNLVFEGAGIRGLAYSGAIKVLEEKKILQNVQRFGGTSSGAITALLLCLNYTAIEMEQIIGSTNYRKFNDGGVPFFGGLHRLNKNYGWYKGIKFETWLGQLIETKTGNANITFLQLKEKYKELYVTGTSLNHQKGFLFSAETFPNMPVKNAVRISMSIPMYYKAVIMDDDGNIYKKNTNNNAYNVMVDGGFIDNFPIQIFDSTKYFENNTANIFKPNPYTIGFRIDMQTQIEKDEKEPTHSLATIPINNFANYLKAFMVLNLERMNRQKLSAEDWQRTVSISDGGVGPKVKKMPKQLIDLLLQNGLNATINFFQKRP